MNLTTIKAYKKSTILKQMAWPEWVKLKIVKHQNLQGWLSKPGHERKSKVIAF
jgi:hypothetical protein